MYGQDEINSALSSLKLFKQTYKEEDGTITIGDIRDLIDKIDLIEECVKKQKNVPTDSERCYKLFGKKELIYYCHSCKSMVDSKCGNKFCSKCGQKFRG